MLKRTISLLLALLMAAGLAACGDSGGSSSTSPSPSSAAPSTPASTEPSAPAQSSAPPETSEPAEDPLAGRETLDVGMFQVAYPEGWNYNEDTITVDTTGWCNVYFFDAEEKDSAENKVYLKGNEEEVSKYRESLAAFGMDLQECAAGNVETQSIGGAEFIVVPERGRLFYRHEPTGITYALEVDGDLESESVKALLEGIQWNLDDGDNKDAPWPWDGEPFQPVLTEQMVGTFTITPEVVPFEESRWVMDIMEHRFCKQGDQLFHLCTDELTTYDYTAEGLTLVSSTKLERDCEYIADGGDGMVYISPGLSPVFGMKDGQKVMESTVKYDLAMHPSGTWGLTFWVTSDTQKVTVQNGVMTAEPWILTDLSKDDARQGPFTMIKDMEITENHIMVAGSVKKDDGTKNRIIVYDLQGNQQLELGSDESSEPGYIGSITGMAETANGFVAVDGNMRRIHFWNKEGIALGSIKASDIFGTDYPWLEDMQLLEDGSLLVMLTEERADGSSDELMLFRLTGF